MVSCRKPSVSFSGVRPGLSSSRRTPVNEGVQEEHEPPALMELGGRIDVFKAIEDPVAWQRTVRDEWTREWDQ